MVILDGHYWVEVDGKVVNDNGDWFINNNKKKFEICGAYKYYKPADEKTQKIAIEIMYRLNEKLYDAKRDDILFEMIILGRDIEPLQCVFNCLIILNQYPNGKIIFGSAGYKYPKGINYETSFCNRMPVNGVWWIFGFGNFKVYNDYISNGTRPLGELVTIEN